MSPQSQGIHANVLYEDNHLLVVDKPAGMPSQPDSSGDISLDAAAREYLRLKYAKPGEAYLGLLHRLDRPTSGVVVLAKTGKAAGRMADMFRRRAVDKLYLALTECHAPPEKEARFRDVLAPLANGGMRVSAGGSGKHADKKSREAELFYRLSGMRADGGRALLLVNLLTGVKHQIRCQLAARGLPVAGDFRYGPFGEPARPEAVAGGKAILLHAFKVAFEHPVRHEPVVIAAPPPDHWKPFLSELPEGCRNPDAMEGRWE